MENFKVVDGDKFILLETFAEEERHEVFERYKNNSKWSDVDFDVDGDLICFRMKKFQFREGTAKGFAVTTDTDATVIVSGSYTVGIIFKEPHWRVKGLAPWRVAILIKTGAFRVTHIFKARFKTLDDAKVWASEKQQAMLNQYTICAL